MKKTLTQVTIIYYQVESLELLHEVKSFPKNHQGRVVLPEEFKKGKSIIAVCEGEITILNKVGDRILSVGKIA
ncbi:TIGR02922 family protein [Colwellia sp. Bg11-28]|uniref:TIGR02922 family protein n=1 Tax=Colwellia sp. Bg11-28 TaxID=2058305 RepID=UPI000C32223A|nr:TIGR02922 family protein [Colwellia sp. Bg11-28]PKH85773.1 TIGR02922 family protein [Colwellia sp. Bg11-28]